MIEVSLLVLFAPPLALMAAGAVIYAGINHQLQGKNQSQNNLNSNPKKNNNFQAYPELRCTNYSLLLVVSAKQEKVIQSIKANGNIQADDCSPLYRATQALWMGGESDLLKLNITPDFLTKSKVLDTSEYDVYFLLISLSNYEKGFDKDVTSIDRSDAFEKLPNIATGVKVSPRLPSSAYELPFLYAR